MHHEASDEGRKIIVRSAYIRVGIYNSPNKVMKAEPGADQFTQTARVGTPLNEQAPRSPRPYATQLRMKHLRHQLQNQHQLQNKQQVAEAGAPAEDAMTGLTKAGQSTRKRLIDFFPTSNTAAPQKQAAPGSPEQHGLRPVKKGRKGTMALSSFNTATHHFTQHAMGNSPLNRLDHALSGSTVTRRKHRITLSDSDSD